MTFLESRTNNTITKKNRRQNKKGDKLQKKLNVFIR